MSIKKLNPYLNFDGTAEKALKLYESALGAKVHTISRFGDVPGMDVKPEHKGRVMHAEVQIGEGTLMLSDAMLSMPAAAASNAHVCLAFDDAADMATKFDALAVGATVSYPIHDTFWGAKFGMLTDAFGIQWMFNCETKQA